MATGTVKFFNEDKGYGFIRPDGGGMDVFVHVTDIQASDMSTLNVGDAVEFEVGESRGGRPKAVNLSMSLVEQ